MCNLLTPTNRNQVLRRSQTFWDLHVLSFFQFSHLDPMPKISNNKRCILNRILLFLLWTIFASVLTMFFGCSSKSIWWCGRKYSPVLSQMHPTYAETVISSWVEKPSCTINYNQMFWLLHATPRKIHMEAENTALEKEKHLNQTIIFQVLRQPSGVCTLVFSCLPSTLTCQPQILRFLRAEKMPGLS